MERRVSLLETEKQRRWWFATHPEFSWGHTGKRSKRHDDEDGDLERIDPKEVDAYVDEQLEYATDPVIIQLLESTKFWFGTEFASKSPAEKRALLRDEDDEDEEEEKEQTGQVQQPQILPGHPAAYRDSYDQYEDVQHSIERLRGLDPAKEAFIKQMMDVGWSEEWAKSRWKIIKDNESMARGGADAVTFPRAVRLGRAILDRVWRMARGAGKTPPKLPLEIPLGPLPAVKEGGRRWKPGDDHLAPTHKGTEPVWDTVRERYWKNEAIKEGALKKRGARNVDRMKDGLAPQRRNRKTGEWESKECHHLPVTQRHGGKEFIEVWQEEHAKIDPYRRLKK